MKEHLPVDSICSPCAVSCVAGQKRSIKVILLKLCGNTLLRLMVALVIISALVTPSAFCQDTEDSQIFIAGFNAYQQKDYESSIEKMNEVLQKHPDTPLRDMALFWLSRSYFKVGNQQEAARRLSQFSKEYPDNPLKSTVEEELLSLLARYEKGEKLPAGSPPANIPDQLATPKVKTEKERIASDKDADVKRAIAASESPDPAEQQRIVLARAEQKRLAAVAKMEQELLAAAEANKALRVEVDAEASRIAIRNAENERLVKERTEQERSEQAKAELGRMNALKAQNEQRLAAENAEFERKNRIKADEERLAVIAAESARLASLKTEEERKAAVRVAKEVEISRKSTLKEVARSAQQNPDDERIKSTKLAYREKAISQYKSIIDKFPESEAAVTAAAKLRELGVVVALPLQAAGTPLPETAQILRLEVAQFAGFEFNLLPSSDSSVVGRPIAIPFEVINRGNGRDSFYLASGFPADFKTSFASAAAPGIVIIQTPELAPGENFRGLIKLVIPPGSIDGLRITHPVKVASRLMTEASQSREIKLVASAPLLRAVLRTEKIKPLPGEKVSYRIAIINVGSTSASDVTFRLNFPPQFEPVDFAASGFRQENKSALILDGLQVNSGENREFNVTFQLKEDSLAGQELLTHAELRNNLLKTNVAFISNTAHVESRRSILVRAGSDRLVVIPGQTVTVPFVVTNTGNIREKFKISSAVTGARNATIFIDLNRDGIRQANEPEVNEVGPLAPREEVNVVVEIKTPTSADDGSVTNVQVTFASEGNAGSTASSATLLTYSRPVLKMIMAGRDGRLKPGDVASFDLTITNNGSNLARVLELQSAWPEQLELVAAEPSTSSFNGGNIIWRFKEMGAGEKRIIKVSFRVKPGTGVGTAIQVKNILTYEDQIGNRY